MFWQRLFVKLPDGIHRVVITGHRDDSNSTGGLLIDDVSMQPCSYYCKTGFPIHDDVIKWKHFRRYWPFFRGIHRSPVNSPHKGQWRGVLMFSLIRTLTNGWVNNRDAGDLRHHRAHCDVTVMQAFTLEQSKTLAAIKSYRWTWIALVA